MISMENEVSPSGTELALMELRFTTSAMTGVLCVHTVRHMSTQTAEL